MDRNPLPPGRTSLDDYKSILDARLFNTPKWYVGRLGREKRIDMRIGPEITKSVVFLGRRTNNGGLYLGGTAFVVRVPHGKGNYDYLVTARHNIIALRGEQMIVRVNTTDGRFKTIDMGVDPKWWCHPSEERSVDVSVVPFSEDGVDIEPVPRGAILCDADIDELYIGQGDEVAITGLFTKMTGEARNLPIVRRGSVAMMPEDKIPSVSMGDGGADIVGYLIEVRSVGGLSGSPVFVRAPIGVEYNVHGRSGTFRRAKAHLQGDYSLLGLAQGHWEIPPDKRNKVDIPSAARGEDSINLGIAIVVPAKKILEVLNHPELIEMREQCEKTKRDAEGTTTPD